jgi:hypothetical protein
MDYDPVNLEWLLDYELCVAARYRRPVSLIMIGCNDGDLRPKLLGSVMRGSDELFLLEADAAIVLSETEKAGALRAVERYKEAYLDCMDLRFAVVSYPGDGRTMECLLRTACQRMARAKRGSLGAVISSNSP